MMEPLIFFLWMLAALAGGVYCLLKGGAVCRDWWSGSLEWEAAWPDLLLFQVLFLFAFICFVVLLRSLAVGQEGAGGSRWVTVPLYLFWGQLCAVFFIAAVVECLENYQLLTRGIRTEGTVIAPGETDNVPGTVHAEDGRIHLVLISLTNNVVRFTTPDGSTYHSSRIYSVWGTESLSPGDTGAVLYLPDNPKIAECPGVRMWMSAHFYFVFGAACSVPFIVCFFRRVKKKSKVKFR